MNVASVKFAMTKNVMTAWHAGTHGCRFKRSRHTHGPCCDGGRPRPGGGCELTAGFELWLLLLLLAEGFTYHVTIVVTTRTTAQARNIFQWLTDGLTDAMGRPSRPRFVHIL
uniref:Uncharacterized protein n=1 Tax=Anopheles atroparvus TaxID=41427 RepID=A0A182IXM3_ANOAO